MNKKAYIYGLFAVLLWSTVATAFKIALSELNVANLLLYSSLSSFLVLLLIVIIRNGLKGLFCQNYKSILFSILSGLLNPFIYYLLLFAAYKRLPAQEALTLNYTWAIVLTLLSVPLLNQKITFKGLLFLLISFIGVVIIASKGDFTKFNFTDTYGVILALSSSVIWALYWIFNQKDFREPILKLCTNFFFGTIFILIFVLFFDKIQVPTAKGIFASIYIGFFEMGITFVLWLNALKSSNSNAKLSSLVYLSPFLSLLFISIILKETIYISTVIGLIFIISGIILQKKYI